ncbi:CREBRF family protein [Megaselia abdita]
MTDNQLYPISGEFYDSSSSNSNFLKLDLLSPNSNSNTSLGIFNNSGHATPSSMLSPKEESPIIITTVNSPVSADKTTENLSASISIPRSNLSYFNNKMNCDFSEYGLDVLDASTLSPTVNVNELLSPLNNTINVKNNNEYNRNIITTNQNGCNLITFNKELNNEMYNTATATSSSAATATTTIWNDIGNAIITTKQEPYPLDDEYIFELDRNDLIGHSTLNDEALFEDLIPNEQFMNQSTNLSNLMNTQQPPQIYTSPQEFQTLGEHSLNNFSNTTYDLYQSTQSTDTSSGIFSSPSETTLLLPLSPPNILTQNTRQQYQNIPIKSRNVSIIKKEYSMSPDRNLGQSVPNTTGPAHILKTSTPLSPSGSSGFGSSNGNNHNGPVGGVIKSFNYQNLSRLSSSAPTSIGLEHIWQRREPRQHLLSTGSLAEAESFSSFGTSGILSPEVNEFSQEDDGFSDSDNYEDLSSDGGSDTEDMGNAGGAGGSGHKRSSLTKQQKERFFWQYNVQAKGPKGQRLVIKSNVEDPHRLDEVTDPVFSPNCSVRGIKHSGKARKGDGNDLTPNPRKLFNIGKELDKLSRTINDMTPVSELPFNVRPKSRKEKNKLASRACRLKKKAQHEANKIKLCGLQSEHKMLLNGIQELKKMLVYKFSFPGDKKDEINQEMEKVSDKALSKNFNLK